MEKEQNDVYWMHHAITLALKAQEKGEVPIGAVIVRDNQIIGQGHNCPIATCDPTSHAEIQAIRAATQFDNNYRLNNTTLYVTLEPCAMCAGAIIQARINRVVFGTADPRSGAAGSIFNVLQNPSLNHRCELHTGVLQQQCTDLLKEFFKQKRALPLI